MTYPELIQFLRNLQGDFSQKDFSYELGISEQYLSDILHLRRRPGKKILEKLGIEKEIVYKVKDKKERTD